MKQSPKILCIEDDQDTIELLAEVLTEEGYQVIVATSGVEGVKKFAQGPDLIICDIEMPNGSGFFVISELRKLGALARPVPFIFITAHAERENHLRARQLGCDDFVAKPIDFELLIEMVRHRLRAPVRPAPAVSLTPRETEVMTWVARGKSSADIAVLMSTSERTVNFHVNNVLQKLTVGSRTQAAVRCAQLGLIDVND